jgi:hypothetical protein
VGRARVEDIRGDGDGGAGRYRTVFVNNSSRTIVMLLHAAGEKPIKQELLELFRGMWVVFWNAALFLAFADVLHRSLDWCCQVSRCDACWKCCSPSSPAEDVCSCVQVLAAHLNLPAVTALQTI